MIRVIVADDENLIREALVSLLQLTADIDVVAQAADGDAALAHARKLAPDVAVLDLQMPGARASPSPRRSRPNCRRAARSS